MVIHQVIHHHQPIPWVYFVAISYSHCIPYILVYIKISKVRYNYIDTHYQTVHAGLYKEQHKFVNALYLLD